MFISTLVFAQDSCISDLVFAPDHLYKTFVIARDGKDGLVRNVAFRLAGMVVPELK